MKKLYTLLALVITLITSAQAPQGFNYQATVRNSAGALIVNQNVYFKFNVMLNSQTSVPVFTETHYMPTDDLGQVNLVVGQGTATTGTFSSINWGTGNYYLGIELNTGSGYVAMGTTQLLSVPYALYANSAGSSPSQGRTTIYLTGDITDAEAAAIIATQLGPVTENIIIQYTTQLTTVDLSALKNAAKIKIENNKVLTSVNFSGLEAVFDDFTIFSTPLNNLSFPLLTKFAGGIGIDSCSLLTTVTFPALTYAYSLNFTNCSLLTSVTFPALTNSSALGIQSSPLLTTVSFPVLKHCNSLVFNNNALSVTTINALLNQMLSVSPKGSYIFLNGQTPPAPPSGQGILDKQTLINGGNTVETD